MWQSTGNIFYKIMTKFEANLQLCKLSFCPLLEILLLRIFHAKWLQTLQIKTKCNIISIGA